MSAESKPFFVSLPGRGLVHLEGADRHKLLQNLITNDISLAAPGRMLYTAMLTPQGKYMHDFFIREGDGFTLLDCEGADRVQTLYKTLKRYKLRMDVKISVEEHHPVYGIFHDEDAPAYGLPDPRHPDMGERAFEKPGNLEEKPFKVWDINRLKLGIPDGSRDMALEKDTALECNLDKLNAVSFEKGCYVGQEITVRMHLRNILKKRLYPVQFKDAVPEPFTDLHDKDGKLIGQMRSHRDDIGLAMLKIDDAEAGNFDAFEILTEDPPATPQAAVAKG